MCIDDRHACFIGARRWSGELSTVTVCKVFALTDGVVNQNLITYYIRILHEAWQLEARELPMCSPRSLTRSPL